jgi:hypothetical protein
MRNFVLRKRPLAGTNTLGYYGVRTLRICTDFIVQAPGKAFQGGTLQRI